MRKKFRLEVSFNQAGPSSVYYMKEHETRTIGTRLTYLDASISHCKIYFKLMLLSLSTFTLTQIIKFLSSHHVSCKM